MHFSITGWCFHVQEWRAKRCWEAPWWQANRTRACYTTTERIPNSPECQLHGFLTREGNFCELLKVQFKSPLVLKSIPLPGNKMTLLASFQGDCQLASSRKLSACTPLNVPFPLKRGNFRCLCLLIQTFPFSIWSLHCFFPKTHFWVSLSKYFLLKVHI